MAHFQWQSYSNGIDCGSSKTCLRFTGDAKGGPERLWFDLDIIPAHDDPDELLLELHHCNSLLGGGNAHGRLHPVWQADQKEWQRLDEPERILLDDGRFIFRWSVKRPQKHGRIAACFPYQRCDLDAFIQNSGLRCDDVGVSASARMFPRVVNKICEPGSEIPGVFLCARQHASESTGSYVLEGILSAFAVAQENAPMVWALPLVDIDGVEEGRYGKNHFPMDHNRSWHNCGMRQETRIAMHEAGRWAARCKPRVFIDLHAPGLMEENCYFFSGSEAPDPRMQSFLEQLEEQIGPEFCSEQFIRQSTYQITANQKVGIPDSLSANLYFAQQFDIVSTTLECSYQSFHGSPASMDQYRELGRRIATTIRNYCAEEQLITAT